MMTNPSKPQVVDYQTTRVKKRIQKNEVTPYQPKECFTTSGDKDIEKSLGISCELCDSQNTEPDAQQQNDGMRPKIDFPSPLQSQLHYNEDQKQSLEENACVRENGVELF